MAWESRIVGHGEAAPADLVGNPRNWRTHPKAQRDALAGVLDQVGWVQDVIVNQRTGYLVDGHARVAVAAQRGEASVPVVYVDLSEDEELIILATLDPLAAMAEADNEVLADLLAAITSEDAALTSMLAELAKAEGIDTAVDGLTDPDDVPEVSETPYVKVGDLYQLGNHRLLCGDSTDEDSVRRLFNGDKADMVWTDPPYGVNVTGKGGDPIAGDISFTAIPLFFAMLPEVLAPGAWVYVCGGQSNAPLYGRMFEKYFRQLPRMIIWDKGRTAVMRHNGYHSCFEIVYFSFTDGGGGRWLEARTSDHADDIWRVPAPGNEREHVTEKPVELPMRALGNSCPVGGIVFDPFSGAGGVVMAAEQLGRRAYAMEIEPKYVQVCIDRWEAFTGLKAERV